MPFARERLASADALVALGGVVRARSPRIAGAHDLAFALPQRSGGPMHVASGRDTAVWIDMRALDVADVEARVDDRTSAFAEIAPATDLLHLAGRGFVEELRVLHSAASPTRFRWAIRTSEAVDALLLDDGRVQAWSSGYAHLHAHAMVAIDAKGARRRLAAKLVGDARDRHDFVLEASLDATGLALPIVVDPVWTTVAPLAKERQHGHLAAVLPSGKALVAGGFNVTDGVLSAAEVYDPAKNAWAPTGALTVPRDYAVGVSLAGGKVLVVGGDGAAASTSEIYDEATGAFGYAASTPAPPPGSRLVEATRLGSGDVLSIAGAGATNRYDAATNTWAPASGATFTAGPVVGLVVAGASVLSLSESNSVVRAWSPSTGWSATTWTAGIALGNPVHLISLGATALVVGQNASTAFDPVAATFAPLRRVPLSARGAATKLADGTPIMIAGKGTLLAYDIASSTWSTVGATVDDHGGAPVAPLADGSLLIFGGGSDLPDSVERFAFEPKGVACTRAAECARGLFCTDGACCSAASCASGSTCAYPGHEGTCLKTLGVACTADAQCGSAHCVDGVCCNNACAGQCQACDLVESPGTCAVAIGKPHGTRPACADDGSGCGGKCDGVYSLACVYPVPSKACGGSCTDGRLQLKACDGHGACMAQTPVPCGGFACEGQTACKTGCAADGDCATGYRCGAGLCVPSGAAKCIDADRVSLAVDGTATQCSPFLCQESTGSCFQICKTSEQCAGGFVCDVERSLCAAPATDGGGGQGGCALGEGSTTASASACAFAFAVLATRRRRRR